MFMRVWAINQTYKDGLITQNMDQIGTVMAPEERKCEILVV